jgi:hypothetical protein
MWKSKGKILKELKDTIQNFPCVNEENEKDLKSLLVEARNIACSWRVSDREDLNTARNIFASGLHRNHFYGWDIKEIITNKLIKKIFSEGMEYYGAGKFIKKWMEHGPFKNKIELIIWLIEKVVYVELWMDEEYVYADKYFCSKNKSDVLELDKKKIQELLAISDLKEQEVVKRLVAKHVDSMIAKVIQKIDVCNYRVNESTTELIILKKQKNELTSFCL